MLQCSLEVEDDEDLKFFPFKGWAQRRIKPTWRLTWRSK